MAKFTAAPERRYCLYFHIDCGADECWILRDEGRGKPCRFHGDVQKCLERAISELAGDKEGGYE